MDIDVYKIKDGEITFLVPTEQYEAVQNKLRECGIHAGGRHLTNERFSTIFSDASIESLEEALRKI